MVLSHRSEAGHALIVSDMTYAALLAVFFFMSGAFLVYIPLCVEARLVGSLLFMTCICFCVFASMSHAYIVVSSWLGLLYGGLLVDEVDGLA